MRNGKRGPLRRPRDTQTNDRLTYITQEHLVNTGGQLPIAAEKPPLLCLTFSGSSDDAAPASGTQDWSSRVSGDVTLRLAQRVEDVPIGFGRIRPVELKFRDTSSFHAALHSLPLIVPSCRLRPCPSSTGAPGASVACPSRVSAAACPPRAARRDFSGNRQWPRAARGAGRHRLRTVRQSGASARPTSRPPPGSACGAWWQAAPSSTAPAPAPVCRDRRPATLPVRGGSAPRVRRGASPACAA